jgi:hypothetical protein
MDKAVWNMFWLETPFDRQVRMFEDNNFGIAGSSRGDHVPIRSISDIYTTAGVHIQARCGMK